jgi:hypothetical protein
MSNGADARARTDRGLEFTDTQRIWLMERDLDEAEKRWERKFDEADKRWGVRLDTMQLTLRRISSACIGLGTMLIGSLILLVVQLGR